MDIKEILQQGWIDGDFEPPFILLVYEPIYRTWYFVIDDSSPIIELGDELGNIYAVKKDDCYFEEDIHYCFDVKKILSLPFTDRQFFFVENLIPLLEDNYDLA